MAAPAATAGVPVVVYEFTAGNKPGADVVRATIQDYRGERWVHLRRWYVAETDDAHGIGTELKPGKGLALRLALLPELKRAVDGLVAATERGA